MRNRVDFVDDPLEQSLVEHLRERIDELLHFFAIKILGQGFTADLDRIAGQCTPQHFLLYLQQLAYVQECLLVVDLTDICIGNDLLSV